MTRAAAVILAVLALAACGGTTTAESLEEAAQETAESSSRFEMSYRATDGSFRGVMSGAFDYAAERGSVTEFEVAEPEAQALNASSYPEEVRVIDGTDYLAYEVDGTTYWVKEQSERGASDPLGLLLPFPGTASDPSEIFSMVLKASGKIENLGLEQVRGDEATHYRASLDPAKLADEVDPAAREEYLEEARKADPLPVDVWVDRESRLRRVSVREALEDDVDVVIDFELFDFGVEVDVEPPPADQLITQERLDELTGEGSAEITKELEALCREEAPKDKADEICEGTEAGE